VTAPRRARIADQIQRELMDLVRFEVKDPRIGMVTITGVEVTSDLSHANVLFTHLGGAAHADEVMTGLTTRPDICARNSRIGPCALGVRAGGACTDHFPHA
jgi:ribosome-binding factor A